MPFRLNVSAILAYQRCPTDWYYRYVLRRVPRGVVHYFESGKFWHKCMEIAAQSGLPSAIAAAPGLADELLTEASNDVDVPAEIFQKLQDEVERLSLLLPHVDPAIFSTKTTAVEKTLEAIIPPFESDITLYGTPDRIEESYGKTWNVQYKSISDRTPIGVYVASTARSLHELCYAYLICANYRIPFEKYGGTRLHIVRKLSRKAIKERPNEAFVSEYVPILEHQVRSAIEDVAAIAHDMQDILNGDRRLTQNRAADTNRYGSALSPYWDVRIGTLSISDDRYYITLPDAVPNDGGSAADADTD